MATKFKSINSAIMSEKAGQWILFQRVLILSRDEWAKCLSETQIPGYRHPVTIRKASLMTGSMRWVWALRHQARVQWMKNS